MFEDRWNSTYFQPLGLQVRIEPPGMNFCDMGIMDVASSKLFRYQYETGISSPVPGRISKQGDKKEKRYQILESDCRGEALRKGRIIILPFNTMNLVSRQLRRTASEGHNGQSAVRATARARPSFQDFASVNQTQFGAPDSNHNPVLAQRPNWPHQRQSDSEGLYRRRSEDTVERAPSPRPLPTTFNRGRTYWAGRFRWK